MSACFDNSSLKGHVYEMYTLMFEAHKAERADAHKNYSQMSVQTLQT